MNYFAILTFFLVMACSFHRNKARANLLKEQKSLKDSAKSVVEMIGKSMNKGEYEQAEDQKLQLGDIQKRLARIQRSIDYLERRSAH